MRAMTGPPAAGPAADKLRRHERWQLRKERDGPRSKKRNGSIEVKRQMNRGPPDPLVGENRWEECSMDVGPKDALNFGAAPLALAESFGMVGGDRLFRRKGGSRNRAPPAKSEGTRSWETTGEAGEQSRLRGRKPRVSPRKL